MYVNLSNQSTHGTSAIGVYFGDESTDTISQCSFPITYLLPQVVNPSNNLIVDTLQWILIRGQFTASGNEKYLFIGNYKTNSNTDTLLVNPTNLPAKVADYLVDDVSCIPISLPAFAGRDTVVFSGDSVYLGREPDVGIDEVCIWFKLPSTISIDTIAGFWIKPTSTSTYVVRQEICGNVKWDTVAIYMNGVGLDKIRMLDEGLKIYPIPAINELYLEVHNYKEYGRFETASILNNLGQIIREEEISFQDNKVKINLSDLESGIYSLQLLNPDYGCLNRKFVISK